MTEHDEPPRDDDRSTRPVSSGPGSGAGTTPSSPTEPDPPIHDPTTASPTDHDPHDGAASPESGPDTGDASPVFHTEQLGPLDYSLLEPVAYGSLGASDPAPGPAPEAAGRPSRQRRIDPLALGVGLASLWGAAFFLLVDDPSLADQANGLWPAVLVITGLTLVLTTAIRRP